MKAASVQPLALAVPSKNERKPSPSATLPVNVQPSPVPLSVPSDAIVIDRSWVDSVSFSFSLVEPDVVPGACEPEVSVEKWPLPVQVPTRLSKPLVVGGRLASVPVVVLGCTQKAGPSADQPRSAMSCCSAGSSTKRWLEPSPLSKPWL